MLTFVFANTKRPRHRTVRPSSLFVTGGTGRAAKVELPRVVPEFSDLDTNDNNALTLLSCSYQSLKTMILEIIL